MEDQKESTTERRQETQLCFACKVPFPSRLARSLEVPPKLIKYFKVKPKSIKFLEEDIGENLHDNILGDDFLDTVTKQR
jgi:hypothetical protein